MKKKALAVSLLLPLILGTSCSSKIKPKKIKNDGKEVILQIGKGSDATYLYADDLFTTMLDGSSASQQLVFGAVQEAVIKVSQEVTDDIRDTVNQSIKDWEDSVKEEASSSNVSYTQLKKEKLTAMGFDKVSEYRDDLLYQKQKETLEKKFWIQETKSDNDEALSAEVVKYVDEKKPYHLKHILVGLDESNSKSLYEGKITTSEAQKLGTVCRSLLEESFREVANNQSLNADYRNNYSTLSGQGVAGDVGIMATTTSFYNEFKFGAYLFDIYSRSNAELRNTMKQDLFYDVFSQTDDSFVKDQFEIGGNFDFSGGFNSIDMSECDYLSKISDKEQWDKNDTWPSGGAFRTEKGYPRNIIFNQKFNNHDIGVITVGRHNNLVAGSDSTINPNSYPNRTKHVNYVKGTSGSADILTDRDGNPIFYIRSDKGVHFMAIEMSPYQTDDSGNNVAEKYFSTLTKTPIDIGGGKTINPYIYNGVESATIEKQYLDAKKNILIGQLQNLIKKEAVDAQASINNSTNRHFDIRLIEHYRAAKNVKIVNQKIEDIYKNYIKNIGDTQDNALKESIANSLVTYIHLLTRQNEVSANEKLRYPMCGAFANINSGYVSGSYTPTAIDNFSRVYGSCIYSLSSSFTDTKDVKPSGENGGPTA